jgi:hypothetical protein
MFIFNKKTHYPYLFIRNYPPMSLDLPASSKRLCYLYMSKKNNLGYNNLVYQTSTSNLDYIIPTIIQII